MTQCRKTIVLTAGGTGGHVFPALSLASKLEQLGYEIHLFTDSRGLTYQKSHGIDQVMCLPIYRKKGLWGSGIFLLSLVWATFKCFLTFLARRPSLVVGFGGYVSAPALLAAALLRLPTILHEQNAVLGRVNRKLAPYVSYVATSFPHVKFSTQENTVLTGNPVRDEFLAIRGAPFPEIVDKVNIFVVGGSQGASIFSRVIPQAMEMLSEEERQRITLVQQCRSELMDKTEMAFKKSNITVTLKTFFSDIDLQVARSHLVIGRSGAMTVTELAVAGRPAIFVPYAAAMDNHQYYNAEQVTQHGGGLLVKEKEFTPTSLATLLKEILAEPLKLAEKAEKIRHFAIPDAVTKLANLVQDLVPR